MVYSVTHKAQYEGMNTDKEVWGEGRRERETKREIDRERERGGDERERSGEERG